MQPIKTSDVRWEWIGDAWKMFTADPLTWILMQVTVIAFAIIGILPIIFVAGGLGTLASVGRVGQASLLVLLLIPVTILILIAGGAYLISGIYRAAIKQARGEAISLSDLFSGGDCFTSVLGYLLLLVAVLGGVQVAISLPSFMVEDLGPITSLVGGLINLVVAGLTFFALPIIVDRRAGVIEAIRQSIELTKPHLLMYTVFAMIMQILSGIGILLCFIGIIITAHFQFTIPAVAYRDVFGLQGAKSYDQFPAPPPPNYWEQPSTPELTATPPSVTAVICHHCGATMKSAANFCNNCGNRLR